MMDHQNIARSSMLERRPRRPFFVMSWCGRSITKYCDDSKLPLRTATAVHHDLPAPSSTPIRKALFIGTSNLKYPSHVARRCGCTKVIDFGIAKATEQRLTDKNIVHGVAAFLGTPAYAVLSRPEMTGLDIDTRSDIYSLGVVLYEMLTGFSSVRCQRFSTRLGRNAEIIREENRPGPRRD